MSAYLNIKKTPPDLTRNPDRSHMPATADKAQSGAKIRKTFSTPDLKQAKSLDGKGSPADQGFVHTNPFLPFDAYRGSKNYSSKIKRGK